MRIYGLPVLRSFTVVFGFVQPLSVIILPVLILPAEKCLLSILIAIPKQLLLLMILKEEKERYGLQRIAPGVLGVQFAVLTKAEQS